MFHSEKRTGNITTAANSKTMNAVEKTALFAEAEIKETTPDFTSEDELPKTGDSNRTARSGRTGRKRKRNQ